MSTIGVIALAAVILSGAQWVATVAVVGWLVHRQRILLAASPKPQALKMPQDNRDEPAYLPGPPFAGGSGGAS